jgi:hypothetical protein
MTVRRFVPLVLLTLPLVAAGIVPARAEKGESRAAEALKNRRTAPAAAAIDANVTLDALLEKKGAKDWSNAKAGKLEGYVVQVEREEDGDVHLALASAPKETDTAKWVVVEVSPGGQKKPGMSPRALRSLVGKKIQATGWLYYDARDQHDPRGTNWELHPVTSIKVLGK